MNIRAILTDLDGTLLEPGGAALPEAVAAVARLRAAGVPVCPVTSKTPAELASILPAIGLDGPAGFENGAGVLRCDGRATSHPAAVPLHVLRSVVFALRRATGLPCLTVEDLSDEELAALTGLAGEALVRARRRRSTLPLVSDPEHDETLRRALPGEPALRLVRGNRFLHLQGVHDKADVVPWLLAEANGRDGVTVALGDAANDAGLLAAADLAVVVPGAGGADPVLLARRPDAVVAPLPHGRGWAAIAERLLTGAARAQART